jgi:hypothetical protein
MLSAVQLYGHAGLGAQQIDLESSHTVECDRHDALTSKWPLVSCSASSRR